MAKLNVFFPTFRQNQKIRPWYRNIRKYSKAGCFQFNTCLLRNLFLLNSRLWKEKSYFRLYVDLNVFETFPKRRVSVICNFTGVLKKNKVFNQLILLRENLIFFQFFSLNDQKICCSTHTKLKAFLKRDSQKQKRQATFTNVNVLRCFDVSVTL